MSGAGSDHSELHQGLSFNSPSLPRASGSSDRPILFTAIFWHSAMPDKHYMLHK